MLTDPKSGDYLAWFYSTKEQSRGHMAYFYHQGLPYDEPAVADGFDSRRKMTVIMPKLPADCIDPSIFAAKATTDIVELIKAARKRTDRRIPHIRERYQKTKTVCDLENNGLQSLIGGVAHHFNNLFMVIQGNVSLLLMQNGNPAHHRKRLRRIEKLVLSESILTNDLLGHVVATPSKRRRLQRDLLQEIISIAEIVSPVGADNSFELKEESAPDLSERSLQRLAGGIARILNRILEEIRDHTLLIMADTEKAVPEFKRLKNIMDQLQAGFLIVGSLFDYAGPRQEDCGDTSPLKLAETILDVCLAEECGVRVDLSLDENLAHLRAPVEWIRKILLELYRNSVEAMPHGGEICFHAENVIVEPFEDRKINRCVQVTITDTGNGMNAAIRRRLFQPFHSGKGPLVKNGLGLARVYGLLCSIGGYIRFSSAEGAGTTAQIYIPAESTLSGHATASVGDEVVSV